MKKAIAIILLIVLAAAVLATACAISYNIGKETGKTEEKQRIIYSQEVYGDSDPQGNTQFIVVIDGEEHLYY